MIAGAAPRSIPAAPVFRGFPTLGSPGRWRPLGPESMLSSPMDTPRARFFLLFLVGALALGWVGGLDFQIEDYRHVADAEHLRGPSALLGQTEASGDEGFIRFFRPWVHGDFWVERHLFGARPRAFHWTSLLLHVLAAWLLAEVLAGPLFRWHKSGAVSAALVFLLQPTRWDAVSWVASRGDLWATLFLLVTLRCLGGREGRPTRGGLVLAGLGLVGALASKESALVFPWVVALVVLTAPGLRGRRPWKLAALLVPLSPLLLWLRPHVLGDKANLYGGAVRRFTPEVVRRMLGDLPDVILNSVTSFQPLGRPEAEKAVAVLMLALAGIAALRRAGRRGLLALAGAMAIFLVLEAPPLRVLREASGVAPGRLHYLGGLVIAPLLAAPLFSWRSPSPAARWSARAWLFVLTAIGAAYGGAFADRQLRARDLMRDVRAAVEKAAARSGDPETEILVLELPTHRNRVPLFGRYLHLAFKPPFHTPRIRAASLRTNDRQALDFWLYDSPRPLGVLRWNRKTSALGPSGGWHLPPPGATPPSVVSIEKEGLRLRFTPPLNPRDGRALELGFAERLTWDFTGAVVLERKDLPGRGLALQWDKRFGQASTLHFDLRDRLPLLLEGAIDAVALESRSGRLPRLAGAGLVSRLPVIRVLAPAQGATLPLGGEEMELVLDDPLRAPLIRLEALKPVPWSKVFLREQLLGEDGHVHLRPSSPGYVERGGNFTWADLSRGPMKTRIGEMGVRRVRTLWRVQGLVGQRDWAQSESPVLEIFLAP